MMAPITGNAEIADRRWHYAITVIGTNKRYRKTYKKTYKNGKRTAEKMSDFLSAICIGVFLTIGSLLLIIFWNGWRWK
ncbi:MAG: hypothetical protein IJI57_04900 [Flexilinea sp.]|nr:hypothetical protein [Flexilinea sp.]